MQNMLAFNHTDVSSADPFTVIQPNRNMESRPFHFPRLPPHPEGGQWSHNVQEAYHIICETYDHASRVLCQEDQDSLRLRLLSDGILRDTIPLLQELDLDVADDAWATAAAEALGITLVELERTAAVNHQ
jgi:hypothetical protein